MNQNKYLPAQRTSWSLCGAGAVSAQRQQPAALSGPRAAAGRVAAQTPDCVSSIRTETRGGWARGAQRPRWLRCQRLAAHGRLQARSLLRAWNCIFFGFLARSLLFISFPSVLFLFSSLPAGLDAVHSPRCLGAPRADSRSRLGLSPAARPAAAGTQGRGAWRGGTGAAPGRSLAQILAWRCSRAAARRRPGYGASKWCRAVHTTRRRGGGGGGCTG